MASLNLQPFYETWKTISAATDCEIWILVSATSRDQSDNQNLLCNDVMPVKMVTLCMVTALTGTHTQKHASWNFSLVVIASFSTSESFALFHLLL